MFELKITGESFIDITAQVLEAAKHLTNDKITTPCKEVKEPEQVKEIKQEEEKQKDVPSRSINNPPLPVFPLQKEVPLQEELDAEGQSWNPNIHSSSKEKTAKGVWRARRGALKAEATPTPLVAPTPITPVVTVPAVALVPPVLTPLDRFTHSLESFKTNIVSTIAGLLEEKKIDQPYIDSLSKYFGVANLWEAFKDENKVAELYENFVASGLIKKA